MIKWIYKNENENKKYGLKIYKNFADRSSQNTSILHRKIISFTKNL